MGLLGSQLGRLHVSLLGPFARKPARAFAWKQTRAFPWKPARAFDWKPARGLGKEGRSQVLEASVKPKYLVFNKSPILGNRNDK